MDVIRIGSSDFKTFIDDKRLYVDKTMFIRDLIAEGSDVTLITRPRRFGKTLNMSMLKCFFDVKSYKSLFDGLNISKEKEICEKHQNQYPVIYITFKDCKGENWEKCYQAIRFTISEMYKEHAYLKDFLVDEELEAYNLISKNKADEFTYERSLANLIKYINKSSNKKVIVLIDEYDASIQDAYIKDKEEYFNKAISFFRQFLSPALKDNSNVYKALLTGVLRISKENIFSGLNNIEVKTILDNLYADKFGFTEDEVIQLLEKSEAKLTLKQMKAWYNGYNIGEYQIYNPWSVVNAVKNNELSEYWKNTSSNDLVWNILTGNAVQSKIMLTSIIRDRGIKRQFIETNITIQNIGENFIYLPTLLLFAGYLTKGRKVGENKYNLKIPNKELIKMFNGFLGMKNKLSLAKLHNLMYEEKFEELEKLLNEDLQESASFHDFENVKENKKENKKTKVTPEKIYHAYMLGGLKTLSGYELKSNMEKKEGRCDIWMKGENKLGQEREYIFEFKVGKSVEQLDKLAEEAVEQIAERYSKGDEVKIGIAFYKKRVKVAVKK